MAVTQTHLQDGDSCRGNLSDRFRCTQYSIPRDGKIVFCDWNILETVIAELINDDASQLDWNLDSNQKFRGCLKDGLALVLTGEKKLEKLKKGTKPVK